MTITATSIRNKSVNLDVEDLEKMLSIIVYPAWLREYEALSVMVVCVRGEEHSHDAYILEGKPYISLALDYHAVAGLPCEAITVVCKNMLIGYLNSMSSLGEGREEG
jgi:hypothetical protein